MKKLLVVLAVLAGIILSGCVRETQMKLYVSDMGNDRIVILDMDLNYIDSFDVDAEGPMGVAADGENIYVSCPLGGGMAVNDEVRKYNKSSPYGKVDSVEICCSIVQLDEDDEYVYVAGKTAAPPPDQHYYVKIIKKSDMSIFDTLEAFPPKGSNSTMEAVVVDDTHIFCAGQGKLRKFNKSSHALEAENPAVGAMWDQLDADDTYVYFVNDDGDLKLYKKSDLSLYRTISGVCSTPSGIAVVGPYAYIVAEEWYQVLKMEISTETIVATFGVKWESGNDDSHLYFPFGICVDGEWDKEAPWKEDILEPTGEVKVEIPRRSGEWTTLGNVMRIHTSNGKDTSSPRAPVEIGQAEVTCSNIDKDFNSFEEASDWYKNLEGYAIQIKVGCDIGGSPISVKLFTGIISSVDVDRLNLTAEIKVVDFLDYFGRVTIEETPVWESISLTQLFKNLVELAFPEWTEGVDYFVEDLGGSTIPAIGYTDLNLLSELKMIAESRGMRLYTDTSGRLHCASRNPDREPLTVSYDYNLEDVTERRDINSIINWVVVHARPHEIKPDLEPPGKIAGFTATPGDTKIDLSWSNPTDDDFLKVKIQFSTTAYPLNKDDGTNIYEGIGVSKSHTGLTNGKKYYYSAFTVDDKGNWSDAAHTSAVAGVGGSTWGDETGPSRISQFTATPEHSKIILTWYNPNLADFEKVVIRRSTTSYPPSPTAGSAVYDGTAETTTDTGLTNGQKYYYSAFTKNTGGDYSGAAFASAIPAGPRTTIQTYTISGSGILGVQTGAYGTSYSKMIKLRFSSLSRYSTDWLRFKHEWDIKVNSGPKYSSNQRHEYGEADDLQLGFSQNIGGIVGMTVTKIRVTASELQVEYKLVYTGGKALSISFRNKLSLRG